MIEIKKSFREKILWVSILILLSLAASCTTKKTTSPIPPTVYLIEDYFPLNEGDEWIWEVEGVRDSVPEPYVDGDVNLGEPFLDINGNGVCDYGEPFEDLNGDGDYDGPDDPWTPGIPYEDRNNNGEYDPPNGKWDEGEPYVDLDSSGIHSWPQHYSARLKAGIGAATSVSPDGSVIFGRRSRFVFSGPPGWSFIDRYTDDGFSNDSLGLRWHSHSEGDPFSRQDDLKEHAPITIAKAEMRLGDSVSNVDTSYGQDGISGIYTWISIFESVECVWGPAGLFLNSLKFKTTASGWTGDMAKYNGISYQWYAKNVGLVKSEGPNTGEHWRLESAKIKDRNYP